MAELGDEQATQLEIATADPRGPVLASRASSTSNAVALEQALGTGRGGHPRVVMFELSGLEFMDSAGISVLVRARSEAGEVRLRSPTPIVRRLIEITGLEEILPIET